MIQLHDDDQDRYEDNDYGDDTDNGVVNGDDYGGGGSGY